MLARASRRMRLGMAHRINNCSLAVEPPLSESPTCVLATTTTTMNWMWLNPLLHQQWQHTGNTSHEWLAHAPAQTTRGFHSSTASYTNPCETTAVTMEQIVRTKHRKEVHSLLMGMSLHPTDGRNAVEATETAASRAVMLHELATQLHTAVQDTEPDISKSKSLRSELLRLGMASRASSTSCGFADLVGEDTRFYSDWNESDRANLLHLHEYGILGAIDSSSVRRIMTMDPDVWVEFVSARSKRIASEDKRLDAEAKKLDEEAQARRKKLDAEAKKLEEEAQARRKKLDAEAKKLEEPVRAALSGLDSHLLAVAALPESPLLEQLVDLGRLDELLLLRHSSSSTDLSKVPLPLQDRADMAKKILLKMEVDEAMFVLVTGCSGWRQGRRVCDGLDPNVNPGKPGAVMTTASDVLNSIPIMPGTLRMATIMELCVRLGGAVQRSHGANGSYFAGPRGSGKSELLRQLAIAIATLTEIEAINASSVIVGRPKSPSQASNTELLDTTNSSGDNNNNTTASAAVSSSSSSSSSSSDVARHASFGDKFPSFVAARTMLWRGMQLTGKLPMLEDTDDFSANLMDWEFMPNRLPTAIKRVTVETGHRMILMVDEMQDFYLHPHTAASFINGMNLLLDNDRFAYPVLTGSSAAVSRLVRASGDDIRALGLTEHYSSVARSVAPMSLNDSKLRRIASLGGVTPGETSSILRFLTASGSLLETVASGQDSEEGEAAALASLVYACDGNPRALLSPAPKTSQQEQQQHGEEKESSRPMFARAYEASHAAWSSKVAEVSMPDLWQVFTTATRLVMPDLLLKSGANKTGSFVKAMETLRQSPASSMPLDHLLASAQAVLLAQRATSIQTSEHIPTTKTTMDDDDDNSSLPVSVVHASPPASPQQQAAIEELLLRGIEPDQRHRWYAALMDWADNGLLSTSMPDGGPSTLAMHGLWTEFALSSQSLSAAELSVLLRPTDQAVVPATEALVGRSLCKAGISSIAEAAVHSFQLAGMMEEDGRVIPSAHEISEHLSAAAFEYSEPPGGSPWALPSAHIWRAKATATKLQTADTITIPLGQACKVLQDTAGADIVCIVVNEAMDVTVILQIESKGTTHTMSDFPSKSSRPLQEVCFELDRMEQNILNPEHLVRILDAVGSTTTNVACLSAFADLGVFSKPHKLPQSLRVMDTRDILLSTGRTVTVRSSQVFMDRRTMGPMWPGALVRQAKEMGIFTFQHRL